MIPSAFDTKVNAVSHEARLGVSMTSDLVGESKYLQACVSLEKVKSAGVAEKIVVCRFCRRLGVGIGSARYRSGIVRNAKWDDIPYQKEYKS